MTAGNENSDWSFEDSDDARAYLREITVLWIAWLVALAALLSLNGLLLVITGFAVVGLWVVLGRPIQARAAKIVPDEPEAGENALDVTERRRRRERVMRKLTFGAEPLEVALRTAGLSPRLAMFRWVLIAVTIAAFWYALRAFVS